jgi:endonuclease/exonuclease/phosphatase family metal-dependent hydrolase
MRRVLYLSFAAALAAALAAGSVASVAAEPIRVLTYNVGLLKVFGSDKVPIVDARAKLAPAELARYAAQDDPTVILLEEIWQDSYARDIAGVFAGLGYASVQPDVHTIVGLNSGLLLLVKRPFAVVEWKFTPFARTTFIDSFARKGVLEAVIEDTTTAARFALIGTHTVAVDTNNGTPRDRAQVDAVMAQAAQIVKALESRSAGGSMPVLALGDFNVGPGYADAAYRAIADTRGLREAGEAMFPGAPLVTWDPGNPLVKFGGYPEEPAAKIDHIFFRDGASLSWTPVSARVVLTGTVEALRVSPPKGGPAVASPLSDHYGFMAELELSAGK